MHPPVPALPALEISWFATQLKGIFAEKRMQGCIGGRQGRALGGSDFQEPECRLSNTHSERFENAREDFHGFVDICLTHSQRWQKPDGIIARPYNKEPRILAFTNH